MSVAAYAAYRSRCSSSIASPTMLSAVIARILPATLAPFLALRTPSLLNATLRLLLARRSPFSFLPVNAKALTCARGSHGYRRTNCLSVRRRGFSLASRVA